MNSKIKIFAMMLAAAAFSFTACNKDDNDDNNNSNNSNNNSNTTETGVGAYFGESEYTYDLDVDASSFDVTVYRTNSADAAAFDLEVTDSSAGLFDVPEVSFAAGASSTTLSIGYSYNETDFPEGIYYRLTLTVPTEYAAATGYTTYSLYAGVPESEEPGLSVEDVIGTYSVSTSSYLYDWVWDPTEFVIDYSDDETEGNVMFTAFDDFACTWPVYGTFDAVAQTIRVYDWQPFYYDEGLWLFFATANLEGYDMPEYIDFNVTEAGAFSFTASTDIGYFGEYLLDDEDEDDYGWYDVFDGITATRTSTSTEVLLSAGTRGSVSKGLTLRKAGAALVNAFPAK